MGAFVDCEREREEVVLLSEDGRPIGSLAKSEVHHAETPLHLAFSLFLFDGRGRLLVQRRAFEKATWPGVWSNSCCGHPGPGESLEAAVRRRTRYELGLEIDDLQCALPQFRYRSRWDGIWENELCPVWIGRIERAPTAFNRDEAHAVAWVPWAEFSAASEQPIGTSFESFSPWSLLEARELKNCAALASALRRWSSRSN